MSALNAATIADVAGVPVPSVVTPTSLEELSAALAAADADGQSICFAGGGSKLDIGAAPARLDAVISLAGLTDLIEYNPSDLVVRAHAGMPFAALQAVVGAAGQRLALDPPEAGATLGGVVAANASGPRRHRYGTVRDLLIGVTFVLADGTVAHTGGKVVKNVAGYDLAKLLTGSYGTLAALADVTFRLHGQPAAAVAVRTPIASIAAADAVLAAYRATQLEPAALELRTSLPTGEGELVALFEGHAATAHAHAGAAVALAEGSTIIEWREDFAAHPWTGDQLGLRLAFPPAAIGAVLRATAPFVGPATAHARAATGVLELACLDTDADVLVESVRAAVAPLGAHVIVVAASPATKAGLDVWGPTPGVELMRTIKDQFDPGHRLAPGRFAGGI
jgi:glycolate oxidase FAD binding subunit